MNFKLSNSVVIVAGGQGLRAGGDIPKQFQLVGGKPVLMHTIDAFYQFDNDIEIIIVLPEGYNDLWTNLCKQYNFIISHQVVIGGDTRFASVRNGLMSVSDNSIVGIHDAARPFVSRSIIDNCYRESKIYDCGVIPVIEEKNSIRIMKGYDSIPFDRSKIRIVQTPQVFPASKIKNAYNVPFETKFTDDASVADAVNIQIRLVEGDEMNFKITTTFDVKLAEFLIQK